MKLSKSEELSAVTRFLFHIPSKVYTRGVEYSEKDQVSLNINLNGYRIFTVSGTYDYIVTIGFRMKDFRPELVATCTCPAEKPCKHQVAAVLQLHQGSDEQNKGESLPRKTKKPPLKKSGPHFTVTVNENSGKPELRHSKRFRSLEAAFEDSAITAKIGRYYYHMNFRGFSPGITNYPVLRDLLSRLPSEVFEFFDQDQNKLLFAGFTEPEIFAEKLIPNERVFSGRNNPGHVVTPYVRFYAQTSDEAGGRIRPYPDFPFVIKGNGTDKEIQFLRVRSELIDYHIVSKERLPAEIIFRTSDELRNRGVSLIVPEPFTHGPFLEAELTMDRDTPDEPAVYIKKYLVYYKDPPEKKEPVQEEFTGNTEEILKEAVLSRILTEKEGGEEEDTAECSRLEFCSPFTGTKGIQKALHEDQEGNLILRNLDEEKKLYDFLFRTKREVRIPQGWVRNVKGSRLRRLFFSELPVLMEAGAVIRAESAVLDIAVKKSVSVFFDVRESQGVNWFEGNLQIEGLTPGETAAAIAAYKSGSEFFRSGQNAWISINELGLDKVFAAVQNAGLHLNKDGSVNGLKQGNLLALESELNLRTSRLSKETREKLFSWSGTKSKKYKQTKNFKAELRSYQQDGAEFLLNRHSSGIGGILADDMGLGKTVQTLAFFDYIYNAKKKEKPLFLVVCPTAALGVWESECSKFTPKLPVRVWHGPERKNDVIPEKGLIVTSFGLLQRDIEDFSQASFESVVVDEAQFAKNHLSLAANSLRKLQTKTFFCLTGTPLENHLGDLWSLLDLILPGYAGSRKSFLSRFKNPDKESLDLLRKKLSPVLIRRRRSEVLTELPPRSDENIVIPMEKEQALLYEATRMEAVLVLQNAGRDYLMKMLPYLTKLRRIACHPDLGKTKAAQTINQLKKDTPKNLSASGKFSWFTEEKEKLESSSEGILVFSQFTDVLDLFEKLLTNSGSSWFRIDGTTPAKKRTESVKRFQEGEGRYFLISLKAGGSALTLNRADTVIHLDPWWNPAAEEQATARAHRMGQKNRVMVYRYISEGTIEEKVVKLQEIKRNLFRDVLDHPEAAGASSVSRAELEELLS